MFVDSFTNCSVVDLKKSARNENGVLNALRSNPRLSTWDMSEHRWIREIIKSLEEKEFITPIDEPYPWHKWNLTEAGKRSITTYITNGTH